MANPSPFTPKQQKLLADAEGHCNSCTAKIRILDAIGVDTSVLKETNNYNTAIIQKAKEVEEQFKKGEMS